MPAEWEPHDATWLAWPHNPETWPGCLDLAEKEFCALVDALLPGESVQILAPDEERARRARRAVGPGPVIRLYRTDDSWMRDIGPTFVEDSGGGLLAIDWTFNAWGGKYPPWDRDDATARFVAEAAGTPVHRCDLVLEGGAIEVDGEGTLLATESSVLDSHRNPGVGRAEIERRLEELLGVTHVVWLAGGIEGDDTDGHIDDVARFVAPGRVVCAREPDPADPNCAALDDCAARLRDARDARGRPLEVIALPMPTRIEAGNERLPASYANFYIANAAVLVPTFGVPEDAEALEILASLFPGRRAVAVPARTLVRGLGTLHCLTQQQPPGA